jgi:hypothetical protein
MAIRLCKYIFYGGAVIIKKLNQGGWYRAVSTEKNGHQKTQNHVGIARISIANQQGEKSANYRFGQTQRRLFDRMTFADFDCPEACL